MSTESVGRPRRSSEGRGLGPRPRENLIKSIDHGPDLAVAAASGSGGIICVLTRHLDGEPWHQRNSSITKTHADEMV